MSDRPKILITNREYQDLSEHTLALIEGVADVIISNDDMPQCNSTSNVWELECFDPLPIPIFEYFSPKKQSEGRRFDGSMKKNRKW